MKCNCIADDEKRLEQRVIEADMNPPKGKPLKRVHAANMAFILSCGESRLQIPFSCEWDGQKKETTVYITAPYCPMCGMKQE